MRPGKERSLCRETFANGVHVAPYEPIKLIDYSANDNECLVEYILILPAYLPISHCVLYHLIFLLRCRKRTFCCVCVSSKTLMTMWPAKSLLNLMVLRLRRVPAYTQKQNTHQESATVLAQYRVAFHRPTGNYGHNTPALCRTTMGFVEKQAHTRHLVHCT